MDLQRAEKEEGYEPWSALDFGMMYVKRAIAPRMTQIADTA